MSTSQVSDEDERSEDERSEDASDCLFNDGNVVLANPKKRRVTLVTRRPIASITTRNPLSNGPPKKCKTCHRVLDSMIHQTAGGVSATMQVCAFCDRKYIDSVLHTEREFSLSRLIRMFQDEPCTVLLVGCIIIWLVESLLTLLINSYNKLK